MKKLLRLPTRSGRIASDDASCRKGTLDSVIKEIAQEYGSDFVQRNRPQLEGLIPPPADEGVPNLPDDLGTGDVQVTLVWNSTVDLDLDLAIEAPGDERVDFSDRTSRSGGELDRDANFPCDTATEDPVENIFWPQGRAPSGGYETLVTYRWRLRRSRRAALPADRTGGWSRGAERRRADHGRRGGLGRVPAMRRFLRVLRAWPSGSSPAWQWVPAFCGSSRRSTQRAEPAEICSAVGVINPLQEALPGVPVDMYCVDVDDHLNLPLGGSFGFEAAFVQPRPPSDPVQPRPTI